MPFVYIHAIVFASWMLFVELEPWLTLTLIVSLEAIFLSTFVMIAENRQSEFQRAKADHDFTTEAQELRLNTELYRAVLYADRRPPPRCTRGSHKTTTKRAPTNAPACSACLRTLVIS